MKILDLVIGSNKWLEARLNHPCASEAPAMMGDSKYMSRKQLLALKKGWKTNPVDSFTQKLFDDGHENEDKARVGLEFDLFEDLIAFVGIREVGGIEFLSSFDMSNGTDYYCEHKNWNNVLAENVRNSILEPHYYWQLEHQMITAGVDKTDFMVSDGGREKRVMMTYHSIPERREAIIAGWKQFFIDLDDFEIEAKKEIVAAKPQASFPVIECRVEGSKVISNLGEYIPTIQTLADEQMSIVLETDQDFADKEAFNKTVKQGRVSLKAKASEIETQFESLADFNVYVKQADSILQKLQSHGEKQVKEAKEDKKLSMKLNAEKEINDHLSNLSKTINGVKITGISADWDHVVKGKRNFEKMQDAIDAEISQLKIAANEKAGIILINLNTFTELASDHKFLFSDYNELILKDNEDLTNLIKMRIADHEKAEEIRLENERKRIKAEEEAKAKREADQKLEEDRKRIRKEEQQKAEAEAKVNREAEKAEEVTKIEPPIKNTPKQTKPAQQPQAIVNEPASAIQHISSPFEVMAGNIAAEFCEENNLSVAQDNQLTNLIINKLGSFVRNQAA